MSGLRYKCEDQTPKKLYEFLDDEFKFTFNPCSACSDFDGLHVDWSSSNYVNPPFEEVTEWFEKALVEREKRHSTSVFLIPFRPDTKYFHDQIFPNCSEIRFFRTKFAFMGYMHSDLSLVVAILSPKLVNPPREISDRRFITIRPKIGTLEGVLNLLPFPFLHVRKAEKMNEVFFSANTFIESFVHTKKVIQRASTYHDATGDMVGLCIPFHPVSYLLNDLIFGTATHILATSSPIMNGCSIGSVIMIWTKTPCEQLYNSKSPHFSVIEQNFHI